MTSRERAEEIVKSLRLGIAPESATSYLIQRAIDEAVAEAVKAERERCIDSLRPDYPDAVRMLQVRASGAQ